MDASVLKSLIAMQAAPEVIDAVKKQHASKEENFAVYEDNWESLMFFLAVANQWNVTANVSNLIYLGLNWSGIESVIRTFRPVQKAKRAQLFDDLRIIERAALSVLNKTKE
jgi:hypothetical protein